LLSKSANLYDLENQSKIDKIKDKISQLWFKIYP
jgi:hypothetical protein